jgi:signal transduction histidine kinase
VNASAPKRVQVGSRSPHSTDSWHRLDDRTISEVALPRPRAGAEQWSRLPGDDMTPGTASDMESGTASDMKSGMGAERALRLRQISHDIQHEFGTVMLLASLLSTAPDVGPESQERARQILGEARWLHHLQRAYEDSVSDHGAPADPVRTPIRLDDFAEEAAAAVRLSSATDIRVVGDEVWALADRLALWRAVRNLLGNAVRAAGPDGAVEVRVEPVDGRAALQVADSGPGFGAAPGGLASLGLGVVHECVALCAGELQIRGGGWPGCCVRVLLPVCPPVHSYPTRVIPDAPGHL